MSTIELGVISETVGTNKMEHTKEVEQISDPLGYLQRNPYGLYYGNDAEGFYEIDWYETAEKVFDSALGTVTGEMLDIEGLDETSTAEDLSAASKAFIQTLQQKFKAEELSKALLESINERLGDQQTFGWWGTFEQLKCGDGLFYGGLIRSRFRGSDNTNPITVIEDEPFAEWIIRKPLIW